MSATEQTPNPNLVPTIEHIVESLLDGSMTASAAVTWLYQHSADAHQTLTDYFAGLAMAPLINQGLPKEQVSLEAYAQACEMMKVRQQ